MDSLVALPVAIPLLAAALFSAASLWMPRRLADGVAFCICLVSGVLCWILLERSAQAPVLQWMGGWRPRGDVALGIDLLVDPASGLIALLACGLSIGALIFSWQYFDSVGTLFHSLMMIFLSALIGFAYSGDLFTQLVFFELMGVATYALTAQKLEESSLEGGLNYAVVNSVAAFSIMFGIGLVYAQTGALNLAQAGRVLSSSGSHEVAAIAAVLILGGYLVKGSQFPFQFWIADAHAVAPTPVCALFSGVMVPMGIYGAIRVYWTCFAPAMHPGPWEAILLCVGIASALIGTVECIFQRHLKRLLAFSTVAHMGVAVIGFGLMNGDGAAGAVQYLVGHGFVKGCLFLCAGVFLHDLDGVDEIALQGRGRKLNALKWIYFAAALGLAGAPGFGTFMGKESLERAEPAFGWLYMVVGGVTAAAVIRAGARIFFGVGVIPGPEQQAPTEREQGETRRMPQHVPLSMTCAAGLLLLGGFCCDLFPQVVGISQTAARRLIDYAGYWQTVFQSQAPAIRPQAVHGPNLESLLYAAGAIAIAVGLAAAWLKGAHLIWSPEGLLKRMHSGRAGDYVAWLAAGLAAMAVLSLVWVR